MIDFKNETENFEYLAARALNPLHFLTTKIITVNKNSKRMNIPHILRARFNDTDKIRFLYNVETGDLCIDFRPNLDQIVPETLEIKDVRIIKTGWSYYVTLPSKWFKHIQPKKASLSQIEEKQTAYRIKFYD
jgi:hypothetical protein